MPVAREALRRAWDKEGVEVVFLDADHRVRATIKGTRVISESHFLNQRQKLNYSMLRSLIIQSDVGRQKLVMAGCKPF